VNDNVISGVKNTGISGDSLLEGFILMIKKKREKKKKNDWRHGTHYRKL